jgi:hypothetical protein
MGCEANPITLIIYIYRRVGFGMIVVILPPRQDVDYPAVLYIKKTLFATEIKKLKSYESNLQEKRYHLLS